MSVQSVQRLDTQSIPAGAGIIPGLDGLRALSIGIVLLGHFFMGDWNGFSSLGVYIFFVISGFLITRLFFAEQKKNGSISVTRFYLRRVFRLYPVLITYMFVVMGVAVARGVSFPWIEPASVFLYFTNYLCSWQEWHGARHVLPIGSLWSLSVEEHFYLLMPFVLVGMHGRPRPVLLFAVTMCVAPLIVRLGYLHMHPEILGTDIVYRLSETRFDSIAWGVLLAALCELPQGLRIIPALASNRGFACGLMLLTLSYAFRDPYFKDSIRYTIRGMACLSLVATVVFGRDASPLQAIFNWRPIAWIGRLSYSLYIWHASVAWFANPTAPNSNGSRGLVFLGATFILATASYYGIERPFLKLRHVFEPWTQRRQSDPLLNHGPQADGSLTNG